MWSDLQTFKRLKTESQKTLSLNENKSSLSLRRFVLCIFGPSCSVNKHSPFFAFEENQYCFLFWTNFQKALLKRRFANFLRILDFALKMRQTKADYYFHLCPLFLCLLKAKRTLESSKKERTHFQTSLEK